MEPEPSIGCTCNSVTIKFVVTVAACFLLTCTLGVSYTFGNLDPYLTSYLRNATGDPETDYTKTLWLSQASSLVISVALPVVGLLANRIPLKIFLLLGTLFQAATFFGTYFTMRMSFWWIMVTYGFIGGVPGAFIYPTSIRVSVQWLPRKTGLLTGIILMGNGVGSLVWNTLTTWYINPGNLQPDLKIGEDLYYTQTAVLEMVPRCFLLLGIIFAALQVLCILVISEPAPRKPITLIINADGNVTDPTTEENRPLLGEEPAKTRADVLQVNREGHSHSYGACSECSDGKAGYLQIASATGAAPGASTRRSPAPGAEGEGDGDKDVLERPDYTPGEACRSTVFWTLWLMCFFLQTGVAIPIALWKAYGETFITDDHFLGIVASASSVFNAIGRPPIGILADKLGSKVVCVFLQCILAVLVVTVCMCEYLGQWAFLLWVCAMFLTMCGVFTLVPTMLMTCFGMHHYNAIQGLLDLGGIVGAILPTLVAPAVKSAFGWYGLFVFSFAALFVSILLNLCLSVQWCKPLPRHLILALDR